MSLPPRVALLIETSNAYARGILRGIEEYIRTHGPWSVYLAEHGRGDRPPSWLTDWKGDGIIARVENQDIAKALTPLSIPIVDVSAARLLPGVPWVEADERKIGEVAAQHFIDRGFREFAFCGLLPYNWSSWRGERFTEVLAEAGFKCHQYPAELGRDGEEELKAMIAWLQKLPKPVAVFACYDLRGQQILDACRHADLAVPDTVAVLGVDNDEILCTLSSPPLSSVIPNTRQTGWVAAELLHKMMKGRPGKEEAHFIGPAGIATRQSSDVAAVDDPYVGRAARFIRENACSGISVADVLKAVPVARRSLEKRFRAVLGHTLREEIARVQIGRVKELLSGTDLPLSEIAERAGFRHAEYLSVAFKRECKQTPGAYRAEKRQARRRA